MTQSEMLFTIATVVLGTMATRFLPFLLFAKGKPPACITYLGTILPPAVIGLLIIFCLKDAVFTSYRGLPELLAILFIVFLHKCFNNTFLSIGLGTACYMFLVQVLFR